jgi:hypothetical protein
MEGISAAGIVGGEGAGQHLERIIQRACSRYTMLLHQGLADLVQETPFLLIVGRGEGQLGLTSLIFSISYNERGKLHP